MDEQNSTVSVGIDTGTREVFLLIEWGKQKQRTFTMHTDNAVRLATVLLEAVEALRSGDESNFGVEIEDDR